MTQRRYRVSNPVASAGRAPLAFGAPRYTGAMDVRVRFLPSETSVSVAPGTSLHEAIRRAGLPIASACGADGICGRCAVEVRAGAEQLTPELPDEALLKRRNRVQPGERLACRARLTAGEVAVTATYW
jgi:2Fe-2S ferredoxin